MIFHSYNPFSILKGKETLLGKFLSFLPEETPTPASLSFKVEIKIFKVIW